VIASMKPVLVLDDQTSAAPDPVHEDPALREGLEVADVYDLPSIDLEPYAAVMVGGMVDQEFLWREQDVLASFLARARVVVFCGQLLRSWLPGCGTFVPATITSMRDYAVELVEPDPVFAGVDAHDLTFRRGVAGFFARGHHPPPPGAKVLAALAGGQPTTWIDRATTPGTVFVHAGNDLLGYAHVDSTAARLAPQLLEWARAEGGV
jgi:hypothetical protein